MSCKNSLPPEIQEVLTADPALATIEHLPEHVCVRCQKPGAVVSPQTICDDCRTEILQLLVKQGHLEGLLIDPCRSLGSFTNGLAVENLTLLDTPYLGDFIRNGDRDFQIQFSVPIQCAEDIESFNRTLKELDQSDFDNVTTVKKKFGEDLKKLYGVSLGQVLTQLNQKTDLEDDSLTPYLAAQPVVEQTINSVLALLTSNANAAAINKNRALLEAEIARGLWNSGRRDKALTNPADLETAQGLTTCWSELNRNFHFAEKCEELQTYYEQREKRTGQPLPRWLMAAQLFVNSRLVPPAFVFQPVMTAHGALIRKAHMLRKLYVDPKSNQTAITQHHYYKNVFNRLLPEAQKNFTNLLQQYPERLDLPNQLLTSFNQANPTATLTNQSQVEMMINSGTNNTINRAELKSLFSPSDQSQQNFLSLKKNVVFEQNLLPLQNSLRTMAGFHKLIAEEKAGKPGLQTYLKDCFSLGVLATMKTNNFTPEQLKQAQAIQQLSLFNFRPLTAEQRLTIKQIAQEHGLELS